MSAPKRTRQRQSDAAVAQSLPPAKRTKTSSGPASGLEFLTDERQRAGKTLQVKLTNGTSQKRIDRVDETRPAVSGQVAVDEEVADSDAESAASDSSEDPSSASDSEEEEAISHERVGASVELGHEETEVNGTSAPGEDIDTEMVDDTEIDRAEDRLSNGVTETLVASKEDEQDDTPSFGDLLRANNQDIIEVTTSFDDQITATKALIPADGSKAIQPPSGNSLGTVLTQALRTNDKDLLETCLQTRDLPTIKATIQRLQSFHVATLMQKLAERLHKRPGRAGPLLVWVQWSLVAHGGYLASQPQLVKRLASLRQVVRDRACSLQPLITLKGKLDMLSAQVELRRSMRAQQTLDDGSDEDDEDDIIYVDDGSLSSSEASDDGLDDTEVAKRIRGGPTKIQAIMNSIKRGQDKDADADDDLINGVDEDAEMESLDEEDGEDDERTNGLIDDEAEESDGDEEISSEEEASDSEADSEDLHDDSDSASSEEEPTLSTTKPQKRSSLLRKR